MTRHHWLVFLSGMGLLAGSASAQLSTNASVQGSWHFRYLGVNAVPADKPVAFQGTLLFDGKTGSDGRGAFTVASQGIAGGPATLSATNTYRVLSSGLIDMTNPLDSTGQTTVFGGVGNGALAMSSTDTNFCDLLVAVPVSTSNSPANLNGKYYLASMEFLNGNFALTRDTFFSATFDGKGGLGSVTINGTAANLNNQPTSQTSNGVTYTVAADGTGTLNFPAPSGAAANNVLLSGNKVLYVSPDGNFFLAGGSSTFDFVIGVKASTGTANGLYFTSYLQGALSSTNTFTTRGADGTAILLPAQGVEIGHQRVNSDFSPSYDDTYAVAFKPAADGTVTNPDSQYAVGGAGNFIIGAGRGSNYQLTAYVKAPAVGGTGVFLNPQAVVNAASSVPFTASVAPGEFVTLAGTGLATAPASASSLPFPTTLGGVQVSVAWVDVNGKPQSAPAPLSFVSPTQINAMVPYSAPSDESLIAFQVTNNGVPSNTARVYCGLTAPGIFTIPSGGIGNGAIQHADFSLVSGASPAKAGETVLIYLTGLGSVTPSVVAGAAAPSNPLASATVPDVYIGGIKARVLFSGLTPGAAGLYQVNVTIPAGVTAGSNASIEIATFDSAKNLLSVNTEATIPIAK